MRQLPLTDRLLPGHVHHAPDQLQNQPQHQMVCLIIKLISPTARRYAAAVANRYPMACMYSAVGQTARQMRQRHKLKHQLLPKIRATARQPLKPMWLPFPASLGRCEISRCKTRRRANKLKVTSTAWPSIMALPARCPPPVWSLKRRCQDRCNPPRQHPL